MPDNLAPPVYPNVNWIENFKTPVDLVHRTATSIETQKDGNTISYRYMYYIDQNILNP